MTEAWFLTMMLLQICSVLSKWLTDRFHFFSFLGV